MALDSANFPSELSITDPPGSDPVGQSDDQIRTVKRALNQGFPNVAAAVSATDVQLSYTINIPADTNASLALKADLAGPQTHTGVHTYNDTIAMASSAVITADGVNISDTELSFINNLSSNAQAQIDTKAPINSPTLTGSPEIPKNTNVTASGNNIYHESENAGMVTVSTSSPSGGSNGDIWLKY